MSDVNVLEMMWENFKDAVMPDASAEAKMAMKHAFFSGAKSAAELLWTPGAAELGLEDSVKEGLHNHLLAMAVEIQALKAKSEDKGPDA